MRESPWEREQEGLFVRTGFVVAFRRAAATLASRRQLAAIEIRHSGRQTTVADATSRGLGLMVLAAD
jgi:hypothetical protein